MSKLYNLKSVYPNVLTTYGIEPNVGTFEDIAINGWELIGNKHTRLYRYAGKTKNKELRLPCNVSIIESVTIPIVDSQETSNKFDYNNYESLAIEQYIDNWNENENPFHQKGKLVKYKEGDDVLYFSRDYDNVIIIYQGVLVDDENGLPLINAKEMKAITAYVAYVELFRDAVKKRNKDSLSLSQIIKEEWLRKCNAARVSEHLSQNDMNLILDVKTRWDRKMYGKSLKPIL